MEVILQPLINCSHDNESFFLKGSYLKVSVKSPGNYNQYLTTSHLFPLCILLMLTTTNSPKKIKIVEERSERDHRIHSWVAPLCPTRVECRVFQSLQSGSIQRRPALGQTWRGPGLSTHTQGLSLHLNPSHLLRFHTDSWLWGRLALVSAG